MTICECKRTFKTHAGFVNHARGCIDELERSEVFVKAIEAGQDPHAAVAAWRRSRLPGPFSLIPTVDSWSEQ